MIAKGAFLGGTDPQAGWLAVEHGQDYGNKMLCRADPYGEGGTLVELSRM